MSDFSARHWYRLSLLSCLLAPLSLVFWALTQLRRSAYGLGVLRAYKASVPVVVVGNFVAGGTGKTPLVLWLVESLRGQGRQPGIVSRGYKGGNASPRLVGPGDAPSEVGDEPLLMAQKSGVPVCIGRRRAAAVRALLAAHPQCDVIVSDDGLQHYALARDFEIAVEDDRGYGNGLLLPAGPLRELPSRAVDAVVHNGEGGRPGVWTMRLRPAGFRAVGTGASVEIEALRGLRLHAVAGIGYPQRFFDTLDALGLEFTPHAFPDHHAYAPGDLAFPDCDAVLMTEKDAVKCLGFGAHLYALRVEAHVDDTLAHLIDAELDRSR